MNVDSTLNPRVMIVDDDPLVRQTLHDVLSDKGISSFSVSSGTAALEACASQPVDLTLLDFALDPPLHGIDTLRALRQDHPDLKVIIITGCPHPVLIDMAHQLHAHQCLMKPIEPSTLFKAIRREFNMLPVIPA